MSATAGLHIPAKTHKCRGINYTWSFLVRAGDA